MPEKKSAKRMTKSQLIAAVADKVEKSDLTKKQVAAVLDGLNAVVTQQLSKKGPGEVIVPGMLKLNVIVKPAVPEHEGINPFTKLPTIFKAKPARKVVKVRVLKGLKDAIV